MVARNEKSIMKLTRLPILRPLLLKREILWRFEGFKNLKDLYGCPDGKDTNPFSEIFGIFKLP